MKLAIIGSKNFYDYEYMKEKFLELREQYQIDTIVSGGAPGADALAERIVDEFGLEKIIHEAHWNIFGRGAGIHRNTYIANDADIVLAFPLKDSKGTWDTIRKARRQSKEVYIY